MFRHTLESLATLSLRIRSPHIRQIRELSHGTGAGDEDLETEYAAARKWLSELDKETIPMNLARISFTRSSGAGGQHVNKTNSKAIFNWPIESIKSYVPKIIHPELRQSRFYVASSDSLQMSAQSSRSQRENKDECYEKLHDLLKCLGRRCIPGETSEGQRQKIERLRKQEDADRLYFKKKRTAKKEARSGGGRDY